MSLQVWPKGLNNTLPEQSEDGSIEATSGTVVEVASDEDMRTTEVSVVFSKMN